MSTAAHRVVGTAKFKFHQYCLLHYTCTFLLVKYFSQIWASLNPVYIDTRPGPPWRCLPLLMFSLSSPSSVPEMRGVERSPSQGNHSGTYDAAPWTYFLGYDAHSTQNLKASQIAYIKTLLARHTHMHVHAHTHARTHTHTHTLIPAGMWTSGTFCEWGSFEKSWLVRECRKYRKWSTVNKIFVVKIRWWLRNLACIIMLTVNYMYVWPVHIRVLPMCILPEALLWLCSPSRNLALNQAFSSSSFELFDHLTSFTWKKAIVRMHSG